MASWEPKYVAAMLFWLIIFGVIKLCWMIKLYILLTLREETVSDLKTQSVPRSKHVLARL